MRMVQNNSDGMLTQNFSILMRKKKQQAANVGSTWSRVRFCRLPFAVNAILIFWISLCSLITHTCQMNISGTSFAYGLPKKKNLAYGETLSHVTISIHVALKSLAPEQFLITSETLSSCCENHENSTCY